MNRNKVLELARDAGLFSTEVHVLMPKLERFASLIEAEMCKHQADKFCETHCSWTDHHADCDQVHGDAEPVACIATNGALMWLKKPEVLYSKPVPLFRHPAPAVVRQLEEIKKVNGDFKKETRRLRSANKNLQDSFDQIYQDCQNLARALKEITKAIDATPVKTYQQMESIAHKALAAAKEAGL